MIRNVFRGAFYAVLTVAVVALAVFFSQPPADVSADGGQWNRGRSSIWAEWEFLNNMVAKATSAWTFKGPVTIDGVADFNGAATFDSTIDVQSQTITATGATINGGGTATQYGFVDTVESVAAATTIVTLAATDSGKTYYTPGRSGAAATGDVTINLPGAAPGLRFTVVVGSTGVATIIDPGAADQIVLGTNAAGDAYSCATLGSTVTCEAVDVTNWVIVAEKGTWADGN